MKNIFKKNFKFFIGLIVGLVISGITAYAITQISATDVTFDNTTSGLESANVQGALNELYGLSSSRNFKEIMTSYSGYVSIYNGDGTNILKDQYISTNREGTYIKEDTNFNVYALKPGKYIVGVMGNNPGDYANSRLVTVTDSDSLPYLLIPSNGGALTVIAY